MSGSCSNAPPMLVHGRTELVVRRREDGALFGCSVGREQQCQRVENPDGRNHREG